MNSYLQTPSEYIKELGIVYEDGSPIFSVDRCDDTLFSFENQVTSGDLDIRTIIIKLQVVYDSNAMIRLYMTHYGTVHWTAIEGSLIERRGKVLQYLSDIGFVGAIALLRAYKIDLLLD